MLHSPFRVADRPIPFFFQAADGIRDRTVTGVQTCALPISLAKERKLNPRALAADVLAKLDVSQWCDKVEIAGAGFLNFRLKTSAIAQTIEAAARGEHLFFPPPDPVRTIVIDFSSPNVAKPMHV